MGCGEEMGLLPAEAVDCAPMQTFLTEILANAVLENEAERF